MFDTVYRQIIAVKTGLEAVVYTYILELLNLYGFCVYCPIECLPESPHFFSLLQIENLVSVSGK